jgi:hypothetical protein
MKRIAHETSSVGNSSSNGTTQTDVQESSFIVPWKETPIQVFAASMVQTSSLASVLLVAVAVDFPHHFETYRVRIPLSMDSDVDSEAKAATEWVLKHAPLDMNIEIYYTGTFDIEPSERQTERFRSVTFELISSAVNPAYSDLRDFARTQGVY